MFQKTTSFAGFVRPRASQELFAQHYGGVNPADIRLERWQRGVVLKTTPATSRAVQQDIAKTKAVMKTGASQAMARAGTGTVSKIIRGARRMMSF